MQSSRLTILIIGGRANESDHLRPQQDFVRQFSRRLAQHRLPQYRLPQHRLPLTKRTVQINYFPSVLLPAALGLLTHLPLSSYDLILWRPESPRGELPNWFTLPSRLASALAALRPYRNRVVMLTPFPHRGLVAGTYRQLTGRLWQRAAWRAGYRVFDTLTAIKAREEYFVTGDRVRLNAVSHELLAEELFTYCQVIPAIRDAQSIQPPTEP